MAHGVLRSTLRKLLESRREPNRFGLHEKLLMTNILQKCRFYVCELNQDDPDEDEKDEETTDLDEDVTTIVLNNPETAPDPRAMMDESVIVDCPVEATETSQIEVPCPRAPSRKRKSSECDELLSEQPLEKISAMDPLLTEVQEHFESLNLPFDSTNSVPLSELPVSVSLDKELEEDFEMNFDSSLHSNSCEADDEEEEDFRQDFSHPSSCGQILTLSSVSNLVSSFSKLSPPSTCSGNQLYLVPYTTNANGDFILQPNPMQVLCLNLNSPPSGLPGCQPFRLAVPPSA